MYGNVNKNTGKLLVAVLAIAMIVAGAAIVFSDNEVSAADNQLPAPGDDGSITLDRDYTLNTYVNLPDGTVINGNGNSIIDAVNGATAIGTTGTVTFNNVVFETTSTTIGEIINTSGCTAVTFNNCDFQINDVRKSVQVFASDSTAVTFNNCDFAGAEVVYNKAASGTVTFTGCTDVAIAINTNGSNDVTIGTSASDINVDADTTITNIVLGMNYGNGWAFGSPDITVNTELSVDEILVGADVKNPYESGPVTDIGSITVGNDGSIAADRSEVPVTGDSSKIAVSQYDIYVPAGEVTASELEQTLKDYGEATINADTVLEGKLTIGAEQTLYIDGATVTAGTDGMIVVAEGGTLSTDDAYLYIGVDVQDGGKFVAQNIHDETSNGGITSSRSVGFGDILTLTGNIPSNATLNVYGTLNTSDLTVAGKVQTYIGSTVEITGTVNVSGTFDMTDADLELTGTINLNGTKGAFNLNNESTVTIADAGVFNVAKGNTLTVGTKSTFTVQGTLAVDGTLAGAIQNKGTVNFNGVSDDATIVMYNGVTLNVTSVSGSMEVTDGVTAIDNGVTYNVVLKDYLGRALLDAEKYSMDNTVTLTNVAGVTITEQIDAYTDTVNGDRIRSYIGTMTVSGNPIVAAGTASGTVAVNNKATTAVGDDRIGILIIGDMSIGAGVTLSVSGTAYVNGTVNATAAATQTGLAAAAISNNGTMTVNGTIVASVTNGVESGTVNAMKYSVTVTDANNARATTYYYTSFETAMGVSNADDGMLYVMGTVEVSGEQTLSTGTIQVDRRMTLNIPEEAYLTIASGAVMKISGDVNVLGVLEIADNTTGLTGTPNYDVKKTVDVTDIYSGLGYALAHAQSGETITLAKDVTLTSDTTIPEGVTLETSRYTVTLKEDVTLTDNGTFAVQTSGNVVLEGSGDSKADIVVNGVMSNASSKLKLTDLGIAGAYFTNSAEYVSNVEYAAQNVDNNGPIDIRGDVTTGDVTFTGGISGLDINVLAGASLTAGTVTLDGATLNIVGKMTGTITAAAGDSNASIVLDEASGYADNAFVIKSDYVQDVDGDVNYLYISGKIDQGTVTVSEGTVTVSGTQTAVNSSNGVEKSANIIVASGATLDVPAGVDLNIKPYEDNTIETSVMDIQGTVAVEGTLNISAATSVSGSIDAGDKGIVNVTVKTTVSGSINGSTTKDAEATINVSAKLVTDGTLSGIFNITGSGYIQAYDGSDVTGASINPTNTQAIGAVSTEFYINESLYMTVYAADKSSVELSSVVGAEKFDMPGYDCSDLVNASAWKDADGKSVANIGGADAVYTIVKLKTVTATMSVGPNLTVYIDGVRYSNGQEVLLTVGDHQIEVQINPGYSGTTSVSFNGVAVTNGTLTVTADMADNFDAASGDKIYISVSGELSQEVTVIGGSNSGDDGLGLTDILLIILVVLIVIMAIMVAMRLMRS